MPKKYALRFVIFLLINFAALGLGSYLMGEGPRSDWYQQANQAPWSPPGWVFGVAWFSIMICFSFYMASLTKIQNKRKLNLFILLTLLNIVWNPIFFWMHEVAIALVVIITLTSLIGTYLVVNWKQLRWMSLLLLPYFIWLCIATSLNAYFLFNNA